MQKFLFNTESKRQKAFKLLLFLISPFISFLYSLRSVNTKSTYAVIFSFCVCFGMAFTISNYRTEGSIDGISYRIWFEEFSNVSSQEFVQDFKDYLTFNGNNQDFYFDTLAFAVSRFTDNYHWFFMVAAMVFAFFQLKTLRFFSSHHNFNNTLFCLILMFLFIWNQIFNINGLRFWTAAWIAVYSVFQVYGNDKKSYLLLAFLTPFVHGSYYLFLLVVLLSLFTRKLEKVWIVLFLTSFFASSFVIEFIQNSSFSLPMIFADKVDYYTDSFYIQKLKESGTGFWWLEKSSSYLCRFYVNMMVLVLVFFNKEKRNLGKTTYDLYLFLLVWMTFCNLFMGVPSVGSRFFELSFPFVAFLWLSYFPTKYTFIVYLLPIVWIYKIFMECIYYLQVLDWSFFVSSPLILVVKYLL